MNALTILAAFTILLQQPATEGTVAAIVRDLHTNGFASPESALSRIQSATDRPGADAPLSRRREYFVALGYFAGFDGNISRKPVVAEALTQLEKMAKNESCRQCELDVLLINAATQLSGRKPNETVKVLTDAERLKDVASTEQLRSLHMLRAGAYRFLGRYSEGITELVPAVKLAKELGYVADQAGALNLLSIFNAYLGDYDRANATANEAYQLAESIGYKRIMAQVELNKGFIATLEGVRDKQLASYNRGLAITRSDTNLIGTEAIFLSNLADYWLTKKNWANAFKYADEAIAISRRMGDPVGLVYGITNRGVAKAHLVGVEAGIADVKEALAMAREQKMQSDLIGISNELVNIYVFAGRYKEAYETLRSVEAIQQEINKQTRDKAVLELQEKYNAETQKQQIEKLEMEKRSSQLEVEKRQAESRLWVALALALAFGAIILLQWLARMRNANRRLTDDVAVLAEQSAHDPLTHAFNRRQGHALLTKHTDATKIAAPGAGPTLGVMLLDIDFFKHVNDTYGHAAGDKVLVEVATRLRALLREQDALVRWGGEEFLLLLPSVRTSSLPAVASRVLHAIADEPIVIGGEAIVVTISVGCLQSPFGAITEMEALVDLADLALYRAKVTGRNRAVCVVDADLDLTLEAMGQDLEAAEAADKVRLDSVLGPEVVRPHNPATETSNQESAAGARA